MKRNVHLLTLLLTILSFSVSLNAQNDETDFEVLITSPENIAGSYEWRGTTDFGADVTENLYDTLVWAGEANELGCEPLTKDLTGKVALVRRGACSFSLKIYHAQQAGAVAAIITNHDQDENIGLDGVIGMLGGDSASLVTIPSVFVSYNTGMLMEQGLAEEEPVEVAFALSTFRNPFGAYSYQTPASQAVPLSNMQVTVINRSSDPLTDLETKVEITDPNGEVTTITSVHDVDANSDINVSFDPYLPEAVGTYNMKFISGLDGKELEREFVISDYTWAVDNGNIQRAIGPDSASFVESVFYYQSGSLVLAGADGVATHITFGLGNGAALHTGDEAADVIIITLYDADKDENNEIDDFETFEDLGEPIEIGTYVITGNETFDQLITVPFDSPVNLKEGGAYFASIAYSGVEAGIGIPPQFSVSTHEDYLNFPTTPLQFEQLYSGWASSVVVTRLHLEGFETGVKDVLPLADSKLKILSNPVTNGQLQYELNLTDVSDQVDVILRALDGKLISHQQFTNVNILNETINTKNLPTGTYFLNVNTEEGFKSKKIVVNN